jgi:hypothetical protein
MGLVIYGITGELNAEPVECNPLRPIAGVHFQSYIIRDDPAKGGYPADKLLKWLGTNLYRLVPWSPSNPAPTSPSLHVVDDGPHDDNHR